VLGKRRTSELEEAIMVAEDTPVPETPIELQLGDLDRAEIRREWLWIDILLLDERPGTSGRKSRVGLAVLQRAARVRRGEAGAHPRLVEGRFGSRGTERSRKRKEGAGAFERYNR
jgi:hypothetical protein